MKATIKAAERVILGNRNAWKHGRYSGAAIEERKAPMAAVREMRQIIALLNSLGA